jgi:hypothetical protein
MSESKDEPSASCRRFPLSIHPSIHPKKRFECSHNNLHVMPTPLLVSFSKKAYKHICLTLMSLVSNIQLLHPNKKNHDFSYITRACLRYDTQKDAAHRSNKPAQPYEICVPKDILANLGCLSRSSPVIFRHWSITHLVSAARSSCRTCQPNKAPWLQQQRCARANDLWRGETRPVRKMYQSRCICR